MNVLGELYKRFYLSKLEKGIIGCSEEGRRIPYFKVKKTEYPIVICQYAIHAREYITTYLALKSVDYFKKHGKFGTVYFLPCVNPDGVNICIKGNPLYKANANMVDLNVNFDACWGKGEKNLKVPNFENYIGKFPFSEKESRALARFTRRVKPDATLSFHSKGQVIYYGFLDSQTNLRDYKIAKELSKINGYQVEIAKNSVGGYKDWCIQEFKIPSFTVEVGADYLSHPIGINELDEIYWENKDLLLRLTEILCTTKNL